MNSSLSCSSQVYFGKSPQKKKKELKLSKQHPSPQVIPVDVGALKGHKQTESRAFQPKISPVFMLLFILLKVKPLVSSRELEHCDPAGISSAPSTAVARTAPKQQSRPSGGNFRLCPEHSLVQLKPLAGSEAMS